MELFRGKKKRNWWKVLLFEYPTRGKSMSYWNSYIAYIDLLKKLNVRSLTFQFTKLLNNLEYLRNYFLIPAKVNQILPKLLHDVVQKQLYIFHGWLFCLSKNFLLVRFWWRWACVDGGGSALQNYSLMDKLKKYFS